MGYVANALCRPRLRLLRSGVTARLMFKCLWAQFHHADYAKSQGLHLMFDMGCLCLGKCLSRDQRGAVGRAAFARRLPCSASADWPKQDQSLAQPIAEESPKAELAAQMYANYTLIFLRYVPSAAEQLLQQFSLRD